MVYEVRLVRFSPPASSTVAVGVRRCQSVVVAYSVRLVRASRSVVSPATRAPLVVEVSRWYGPPAGAFSSYRLTVCARARTFAPDARVISRSGPKVSVRSIPSVL